jgi:site-specific DNA-cytosine methylase
VNELSLFSGAGGGLLATQHLLGWRTIGYVEIDDYCQRVLRARIDDGLPQCAVLAWEVLTS